jgi:hypothetical protein
MDQTEKELSSDIHFQNLETMSQSSFQDSATDSTIIASSTVTTLQNRTSSLKPGEHTSFALNPRVSSFVIEIPTLSLFLEYNITNMEAIYGANRQLKNFSLHISWMDPIMNVSVMESASTSSDN